MARPGIICKLRKGKVIDNFNGFVDTFNWIADFVANLTGKDGVEVDRSDESRPVIRGSGASSGGGAISIAADQIVVTSVTDGDTNNPYSIVIKRGKLEINEDGALVVTPDATLTQYIPTVAHSAEMDGNAGGA